MPKAVAKEATLYRYPAGEPIAAYLKGVEERAINYFKKDPKTKQKTNEQATFYRWRWTFELTGGEFAGEEVYGDTEAEYNTREDNLVRQWTEALLGRELDLGEELDTDAMLDGLPCYVVMAHGDPREKRDGGLFYPCDVVELYPMSSTQPQSFGTEPPF